MNRLGKKLGRTFGAKVEDVGFKRAQKELEAEVTKAVNKIEQKYNIWKSVKWDRQSDRIAVLKIHIEMQ